MASASVSKPDSKNKWGIIGVIIGAVGASICCIGPLVLLVLGISGAWVGNLSAFDAYRPFFMLLTIGFLGFAFYRVYRKPKEDCADGSCSPDAKTDRRNKIMLWIVTVFALLLLAFPYLAPGVVNAAQHAAVSDAATEQVTLKIDGMTCGGCAVTAQASLAKVEGVVSAEVTFDLPQAIVTYDPSKVKPEDLTDATANAGYPSTVQNNKSQETRE